MSKYVFINFGQPIGGEASIFSIYDMPPRYSMLMQNCHVSPRGGVEKMPGYTRCNEVSCDSPLLSGYEFRTTNGGSRLLCAGGGAIYEHTEGASALSPIKTGLDRNARVFFSTFNDLCIITNGVDPPMKYDGTQVSELGGGAPSTAITSHVFKGRVWLTDNTNRMLATCSALNDPEDYTGNSAGYIDFQYVLKEGDVLVDIATYVDLLIFFFRNHIAIYSGTTPVGENADFRLIQLIDGCGLICPGAYIAYASDIIFVHDSGVKSLKQVVTTGALTVGEISQTISSKIRDEIQCAGDMISMAHFPSKSWIMILINNKIWVYSYLWRAWAHMTGMDANGIFSTIAGEVYLCGNGLLYKYGEGYSFDGAPISMRWETAYLPFSKGRGYLGYPRLMEFTAIPAPESEKVNYWLGYDYEPEAPMAGGTFSIPGQTEPGIKDFNSVDDVDAVTNFSGGNWSAYAPMARMAVPAFGGGKTVQAVITNESTIGPLEVNNILIYAEIGGL